MLADTPFTTSLAPEDRGAEALPWAHFTDQDVTVAGDVITAKGSAYVEFAAALADRCGLFEQEIDRENTVNFFKNRTATTA